MSLENQLRDGLKQLGLELANEKVTKLLQYLELLQKWNKVYNLTAIRDPQEMLVKHLLDSLAVVPHIQPTRLIDVGTGGGLPGIPLAICYPDAQIDLLDSNSKKTRFLIQAKAELGLVNTQVIHGRVEEHHPEPLYDAVISRAFAALEDMLYWTNDLLPAGGVWWAMKAQKDFEPLDILPQNAKLDEQIELNVPGLNAERRLIKLIKTENTKG
ncbi:16S rRNA (guanine(527)-N(7))-methyltransferase RsmG [Thiomicrorhabdus indica]|uniref:16S rRNA (guanine(527)-N(7))-methyltransferase RsmG n=1 Tax=Thiomicrorhabdus indica TaxID=2267253 RepID=UPI00102DAABB|nr:16S rRNA (guanine(527)-N(7))-methyltransferase RsmG [Thiomicrorhabdus indica]